MIAILALALAAQVPAAAEARALVPRLGSPAWAAREAAQSRLEELARRDGRILLDVYGGTASRDAEVRRRAVAVIRRVHPCTGCLGSGIGYTGAVVGGVPECAACYACKGAGSIWFEMYAPAWPGIRRPLRE